MIEDRGRRHEGRDRLPAAKSLSETHHVRNEALMLEAMELAGARQTDLDFIAHRQDAVPGAQPRRAARRKPGVGTSMPPSDWIGSMKKAATSSGGTRDREQLLDLPRDRIPIRPRRRPDREQAYRPGWRAAWATARDDRKCSSSPTAAVISAGEGENPRSSGCRDNAAQRGLEHIRSRMTEYHFVLPVLRQAPEQRLGKLDRRPGDGRKDARSGRIAHGPLDRGSRGADGHSPDLPTPRQPTGRGGSARIRR